MTRVYATMTLDLADDAYLAIVLGDDNLHWPHAIYLNCVIYYRMTPVHYVWFVQRLRQIEQDTPDLFKKAAGKWKRLKDAANAAFTPTDKSEVQRLLGGRVPKPYAPPRIASLPFDIGQQAVMDQKPSRNKAIHQAMMEYPVSPHHRLHHQAVQLFLDAVHRIRDEHDGKIPQSLVDMVATMKKPSWEMHNRPGRQWRPFYLEAFITLREIRAYIVKYSKGIGAVSFVRLLADIDSKIASHDAWIKFAGDPLRTFVPSRQESKPVVPAFTPGKPARSAVKSVVKARASKPPPGAAGSAKKFVRPPKPAPKPPVKRPDWDNDIIPF